MKQPQFKGVTPKNQKIINSVLKLHETYEKYNDARDKAESVDNEKLYNKYNKMCENQWNKFADKIYDLPKGLQKQIWKYLLEGYYM